MPKAGTAALQDVTFASPLGADPTTGQVELYASAEQPSHQCTLVYPGPRMRLTTSVQVPGRRYELRGMFVVQIDHLEDSVFATHRDLPVHGYGRDQKDALSAFCEMFDMQYRSLVEEDENNLTPGGIQRRQALRDVVARVIDDDAPDHAGT